MTEVAHRPAVGVGRVLAVAMLTGALAAGTAAEVAAQGFGVYEQGTCVMGRAGAAVADPCGDASSIFFNPAGLARIDGTVISGGVTGIWSGGDFAPDGPGDPSSLDTRVVPVPHLYLGLEPTPEWGLGVGVYAPYGLETSWPLSFEGRFVGHDNALRTVYVQPTAAWSPAPGVSLGAGLTAVWSEVELNRRLDLAGAPIPGGGGARFGDLPGPLVPPGTDYADASLEGSGDGIALGAHFGFLWDVTPALRAGARYLLPVSVSYEGTASFEPVDPGVTLPAENPFGVPAGTPLSAVLQGAGIFEPGGPLADQPIRTEITMPAQLVAGLAWDATPALTLTGDWQWTSWSDFDTLVLDFVGPATPDEVLEEDFRSTSTVRLGAEWEPAGGWTLRGGWIHNQAAAPDRTVTPLLPEADRNGYTLGLGWMRRGGVGIDVAYMYIDQEDRRGRVRNPAPGERATPALNTGVYSFAGHLVGATLRVRL